jgi:hypothetical protein
MTNYENVWSSAQNDWSSIDYKGRRTLNILTVFAWVGMIGSLISILFVIIVQNTLAVGFMFLFLTLWLGCGLAVIRIRRRMRRIVTLEK